MVATSIRRPGRTFVARPVDVEPPRVDRSVVRRGIVYGIAVTHEGQVMLGYVGKTRQTLKEREEQHRACQPWGDRIVGGAFVIEQGMWNEDQLDEVEQHYIRNGTALMPGDEPQRPLFNIDYNRDNPNRVLPWDALAQRQAREPGWTPPPKGARIPQQRGPVGVQPSVRPRVRRRFRWTRGKVRFACWSAAWMLVAFITGGWTAASAVATARDGLVVGVGAASVSVGGLLYSRRPRRRRRSSRRGRR